MIARASTRPAKESWTTMRDFSAFAEMERRSWSDTTRASGYVALFASAPDQAIEGLLAAAGAERALKALDLCCGQGNVSEALLGRGCHVVGVDFSPAMLAFARRRARNATFMKRTYRIFLLATPSLTSWCRTSACAMSLISHALWRRRGAFFVPEESSR
jgi:SAM-dependent methyltransferase